MSGEGRALEEALGARLAVVRSEPRAYRWTAKGVKASKEVNVKRGARIKTKWVSGMAKRTQKIGPVGAMRQRSRLFLSHAGSSTSELLKFKSSSSELSRLRHLEHVRLSSIAMAVYVRVAE